MMDKKALAELLDYLESPENWDDRAKRLAARVRSPKFRTVRNNSPTKAGNVRCMDCRCNGVGCPGMPRGYEQALMDHGDDARPGFDKWRYGE